MTEESVTVMLQPGDDTETILEKVRTANTQQINMIVPPGTKALQTLGGFTMLRKACDITGLNVIVYSADEKTCDMAKVCRFEVVRLEPEARPGEVAAPSEEAPRIVVSTRPPEPEPRVGVGPAVVGEAAGPVVSEERLQELTDEDLALFEALESMSHDEDVELRAEDFVRGASEPFTQARPRVAEEPVREEGAGEPAVWQQVLAPVGRFLAGALANLYIGVVKLFLSIAARFQPKREAVAEAGAPAAVTPRVRTEEEMVLRRSEIRRYYGWTLLGVAAFVAFLLAVYFLSLPRPVVVLTPREKDAREMDLSLTVVMQDSFSAEGAKVSTEGGTVAIPAKAVVVEFSGEASAQVTGEAWISDATATGTVVFTNLTAYAVAVPAGTSISGGGTTFHTLEEITVPASSFIGSGAYVGKAAVGVAADTPGSAGNVEPWTLMNIEGNLSSVLLVVNEVATKGGAEHQATIVTAEDQDRLRQQLITDLEEKAYAEFQSQVGDLEVLSGTMEIETVEEEFNHAAGSEAKTLVLTARVRASALASSPGLLDQALAEAVSDEIGGEKAGQQVGVITHGAVEAVQPVQGVDSAWTYQVHARVPLHNVIDEELKDEIRRALRGLTYDEAFELLAGYSDRIAGSSITPVLGRLPGSASRIRVVDINEIGR